MKLPSEIKNVRDRYVAKFPLWSVAPSEEAEERARTWTLGLISQIEYEYPGRWYGSKRADPGRPLSKDGIAQKQGDGKLFCWDLLTGAGSGSPKLNDDPDSMDITGQIYEEVEGHNIIAGEQPPEPAPPVTGGIPYDENYSIKFGHGCNDVYTESGATMDAGMISVHSQRCAWDYYVGGLSQDESYQKHINEFRAVYGLPPQF